MATLDKYQSMSRGGRVQRYFSEDFRRKKVKEIEQNLTTVAQICREYQVSSPAVYKWIYRYSAMRKKGVQIDFLEKMIELAEKEYGIDIKKKYSSRRSSGSGRTGKGTRSK